MMNFIFFIINQLAKPDRDGAKGRRAEDHHQPHQVQQRSRPDQLLSDQHPSPVFKTF